MFSKQTARHPSTRQAVSQRKARLAATALEDNRNEPVQRQANKTGLPDNLKSGMENISGMSLDHVRVHYNSSKPAAVQAHAYAQGSDIHLGSGQEKHLPHELGHVVQQAQGRVAATTSVAGMAVNDSPALEHEADMLGAAAIGYSQAVYTSVSDDKSITQCNRLSAAIQRRGEYNLLSGHQRDEVDTFVEIDYHNAAVNFETQLGRLASTHPKSIAAADDLSELALSRVLQHLGPDATMNRLGQIFGTDSKGNTGSVGQEANTIRSVFESGNFREKMTLVYNAYANRELAPIIVNAMTNDTGQDLGQIFARPADLMRDRTERHQNPEEKSRTNQRPDDVQFPPLSDRERKFSVEDGKLQWQPGMNYFFFDLMSQYADEARQLRVPYGGGRSGTTYILLRAASILGVANLYDTRLACLGWMIPAGDHTFYEIMIAGKDFGLEYIEGPLGYRHILPLNEGWLRGLNPNGLFPDEYLDIEYKDAFARQHFSTQSAQLKKDNCGDVIQAKLYYHGRPDTRERVGKKEVRGIMAMIESSRTNLDFDPIDKGGFYLTGYRGAAVSWSKRKAERTRNDAKKRGAIGPEDRPIPTLYTFDVNESDIISLLTGTTFKTKIDENDKIDFQSEDQKQAWKEWVLASRINRKNHADDYVQGPMISNPVPATGVVRAQEKDKKRQLTDEEFKTVARDQVHWDQNADQIALYTQKAANLFEMNRKPTELLEWDDRDYNILEVRESIENAAVEQLDRVRSMNRDEQALFMYNNRLFSDSRAAKEIMQKNKLSAINHAFSDQRVRKVVWEEVMKMPSPPGSVAYEYDRYVNGSKINYDFEKLKELPGVEAAMSLPTPEKVVKENNSIKTEKSDGDKKLEDLTTNERVIIGVLKKCTDYKISLPNSRDDLAVKEAFSLSASDFYDAFLLLKSAKLVHNDKTGPFLTKKGIKMAQSSDI